MIARPTAQNLAKDSASTSSAIAPAAGPFSAPTSAPIQPAKANGSGAKSSPKRVHKTAQNGSLPNSRAKGVKRRASAVKSESRLSVAETTYKGKKAWRVTLGKWGKNLLSFRIRPSGSGFFVAWRSGNTERYVCYLAVGEWHAAKRGSAASFAKMIVAKLDARRAAGEALDKIASLHDRVKAFV